MTAVLVALGLLLFGGTVGGLAAWVAVKYLTLFFDWLSGA